MNARNKFFSTALALAIGNTIITAPDDFDPDLLYPGIEEEEEEEEEGDDLDLDGDDDDDADRGDAIDPNLPPEEDDDPDKDEGDEEDKTDKPGDEPGDDLDPEALAELAGESKPNAVPHARFNEVNTALKAERAERLRLEEELARAKGQAPKPADEEKPKAYDFDAAEERYMDAMLEGDRSLAKQIRSEIRTEEKKDYGQQATQTATQAAEAQFTQREAATAQQQLQTVLTDAVTKYPFLNDADPTANADAIDEVVAMRDLYIKKGASAAAALAKAVEKVGPRYAEEPAPKTKGKTEASEEQIRRNLEREKKIPAALPGVGERGKDIDYAKLSEDEFDSLPEADKRKARGDFVKEA